MGQITGGDMVELSYSNPDVGNGFFYGLKGEDSTYVLGGFENEDNGAVDGASRLVITKTRKPGKLTAVVTNDMGAANSEFEAAQGLANSLNETVFTMANVNGGVYAGGGTVVGSIELSADKSTFTINVASGSGFVKQ